MDTKKEPSVGYDGIKPVNNEVEENKMITEGSN